MRYLILLFLLGLDLLSKWVAMHWIPPLKGFSYPFGGIEVFSFSGVTFSLNYVVNTGAAWGAFAGHSGLLFVLRTLIIFSLILYLLFQKNMEHKFPLWLIVTGAIGNVVDYGLYGYVIDFFHFTFWNYSFPIFNVADSCITLGAFALLFCKRSSHKQEA